MCVNIYIYIYTYIYIYIYTYMCLYTEIERERERERETAQADRSGRWEVDVKYRRHITASADKQAGRNKRNVNNDNGKI